MPASARWEKLGKEGGCEARGAGSTATMAVAELFLCLFLQPHFPLNLEFVRAILTGEMVGVEARRAKIYTKSLGCNPVG